VQPCDVGAAWSPGVAEVVAAVLERQALVGSQVPRIMVVPEGDEHPLWSEVVDFVAATGTVLDPWQLEVLRVSLLRRDERWAAFAVAVCAPRQNGKNGILEMRELIGCLLLGEKLVIHSAHLADTSKEAFRRLDDLIDANAWLSAKVRHIWRTNGHESIEFTNGHRIRFRTRTRGGGRGFAGSPVIFDEPMFLPEVSMGSILPVVSAQPDPQIWYTGSAVDQTIHEDGVVFARVRDRALGGKADRLAYFEWSLDAASPDDVDADAAADPLSWAATNPALGIRISPEYVEEEQGSLEDRTFAVERLGVGDWPATDGSATTVINMDLWAALTDLTSALVGPVCFSFDVSPNRSSSSISAAGQNAAGLFHVETVDSRDGTGWVAARLAELCEKHETVESPDGASVFCDAAGPASSLIPDLEDLGVKVEALSAPDNANACGFIFDLVEQARLRHLGTREMTIALKGAATRPLSEKWAWARKQSSVNITPLVAATVALWGWRTASMAEELQPFVL
jgi:hypothetical protein